MKNAGEEDGKVYLSVQILPKQEADRKKVGEGRSDPNAHPNLPNPEGRLQWSWNPLTLLGQLFGPRFKTKICIVLVVLLIISAIVFIVPSLFGSLLAKI